ncbi:hypothetical protein HMPREF0262_01961 [Clostridium sp. ATCC 29733]|nr:hypothetical protein HMPREF0262_01961 [Clostridium sp. ATCC 29733]
MLAVVFPPRWRGAGRAAPLIGGESCKICVKRRAGGWLPPAKGDFSPFGVDLAGNGAPGERERPLPFSALPPHRRGSPADCWRLAAVSL